MAIIDTITSYYGFTLDGTIDSTPIDINGQVTRCIVAIVYPVQVTDVNITISNGENDWAAKMGDGSIIPLFNPEVLYVNRDNAIIQFDMDTAYPSNSPLTLVYHSDTASFNLEPMTTGKPFETNSVSGHFAYTVEGYGGTPSGNGLVNKLMATIPFPNQISTVRLIISNDPSHWGARMGDGSIINLRDPEVIATNSENAVVIFTMDTAYPSNSPCILIYRSKDASIQIEAIDDDLEFHPVSDLIDIPTSMISGQTLDLNCVKVMPWNASKKEINWSVITGNGEIRNKHYLYSGSGGKVTLRATIENSMNGEDHENDFYKTFDIEVIQNVITISAQPIPEIDTVTGEVNYTISVVAKSTTDKIQYQWYLNNRASMDGANPIGEATNSSYIIPPELAKGDYYYICRLTSDGATTVNTSICHLHIAIPCNEITILPREDTMWISTERQLYVRTNPADAELRTILWESSNTDVIEIDENGRITSKIIPANTTKTVRITATRIDGKPEHTLSNTLDITVSEFVPVTDITGISGICNPGMNIGLQGIVHPNNATNKIIKWDIVKSSDTEGGNVGCTIANNVLYIPKTTNDNYHNRWVMIRGTITNGTAEHQDYSKEFLIHIYKGYIPITDITLVGVDFNRIYNIGEAISLNISVEPIGASIVEPIFRIVSGSADIRGNNKIIFTQSGTLVIEAVIKNGGTDRRDFVKSFTFNVSNIVFNSVYAIELKFPHVRVEQVTDSSGNITNTEIIEYSNSWDPKVEGNNPFTLNYTILPTNATNKNAIITLKDAGSANLIYDNATKKISCDNSLLENGVKYNAVLNFRIPNGVSDGIDYSEDIEIEVFTPKGDPFIPVTDITMELPSPLRALYPILSTRFTIHPENHTANDLIAAPVYTEDSATVAIFDPSEFDTDIINPVLNKFFPLNLDEEYLFPWSSGSLDLNIKMNKADCTDHNDPYCTNLIDFNKTITMKFDEPFIRVRNITHVPTTIYANQKTPLFGLVETNDGWNYPNPYWDEEKATYDRIYWTMDSSEVDPSTYPNTAGATLIDRKYIQATKEGSFTIKAIVDNGIFEDVYWHNNLVLYRKNYEEYFTINVIGQESERLNPIVSLTLQNGNIVEVKKVGDISLLCSDLSADTNITIGNYTFKKENVTEVKFWDITKYFTAPITSLYNFGREFTNLTKIDRIPEGITGEDCLGNFLYGCTSFNQPITIPSSVTGKNCMKYFMKGCTSFNSDITFQGNPTGEGCMHGFLYGCTSFNQPITIPRDVSGENCLRRFLYGCTSFNSLVTYTGSPSGKKCMFEFMYGCTSFNQPFSIPSIQGNNELELGSFMRSCDNMHSLISVPIGADRFGVNEQTLSTRYESSVMYTNGIGFTGEGASALLGKLYNSSESPCKKKFFLATATN